MTVPAAPRTQTYPNAVGTGPFTYSFPVAVSNAGVPYISVTKVAADGTRTPLSYPGGYNFALVQRGQGGGSVTPTNALVNETLVIQGNTPVLQGIPYRNLGDFLPETHEKSFDYLTMISQEQAAQLARALKLVPEVNPGSEILIDTPVPNTVVVWNSTGTGLGSGPTLDLINEAASNSEAVAAAVVLAGEYATQADIYAQAVAFRWKFGTGTSIADPTAQHFTLNNASIASATHLVLSTTTNSYGTPDIHNFIATWDDSTSSVKGYLLLRSIAHPEVYAIFTVNSALTDHTTWMDLPVNHIASSGSFISEEQIVIGFFRSGDAGTLSSQIITSNSATAFAVGLNGASYPTLNVDCSVASAINGVTIKGQVSGTNASITATSSDANAGVDLVAKGFSYARLMAPNGFTQMVAGNTTMQASGSGISVSNSFKSFTANDFFTVTAPACTSIPASTEMIAGRFNFAATQAHSTGGYSLQRDFYYCPSTHTAAGASAIATMVGMYWAGGPIAGTNVTSTSAITAYFDGRNVGSGVTNSYGLYVVANSGASTANYAAQFVSGSVLLPQSTTSYASVRIIPGNTPTTPTDGDVWGTSAGLFARVNGVTKKITDQILAADCFCGEIGTATNRDYVICLVAPYALTITSFITQSASGTCTATLKDTAGTVGANSVSTSLVNNTSLSNTAVAQGEKVYITISSNSAAKAVAFVVNFTRAS